MRFTMLLESREITGHYFSYCQFCEHDGKCELKHHEYLGRPGSEGVDKTPYRSHEDLAWHMSSAQQNTPRGNCVGRIKATASLYYPLQCECGTVINSLTFGLLFGSDMCAKFEPNELGKERLELAKSIARTKHRALRKLNPAWLPDTDPDYHAEMEL